MVRIRLKRMGRTHRPFYRINAIEKREKRDGRVLENLGWYNPVEKDESKQVSVNEERAKHWMSVGAQPSDTVKDIFVRLGLYDAGERKAELEKRFAKKIKREQEERKAAEEAARREAEAKAAEEAAAKKAEAEAAAAEGGEEEKAEGAEA
jgi:small subunit ribosomal protein S16